MSLRHERFNYSKGLHELDAGCYAWLQPNGSWGLSNAGLVVDGDESLLIDTLYDFRLTNEMLEAMKQIAPSLKQKIDILVNTHSNGDHCNGNFLTNAKQIITSKATQMGMLEESPTQMIEYLEKAPHLGDFGRYFIHCFGQFHFEEVKTCPPTRTFEERLQIMVGNKIVDLIQVGPAHTTGDIIVHLPQAGIIYSGDILFIEGHPLMWVGPLENWLKACQLMIDLEPKIVIPGHGPITNTCGIKAVMEYFYYVAEEARKFFDKGVPLMEAVQTIMQMNKYPHWIDSERLAINIAVTYRELIGESTAPNMAELFALMVPFAKIEASPSI